MRVFAVVVTFNGERWIEKCVRSLQASEVPLSIIVIDNASSDRTVEICEAILDFKPIRQATNLGFGVGNNVGIALALGRGADFVFLLNQDATIEPCTVERLLQCANESVHNGITCPIQLDATGQQFDRTFYDYYLVEHGSDMLTDAYFGRLQPNYVINSVPAAAWLVRRSLLESVGGFDPLFFMYGEDDDLCNRARHHGFKIHLVPSARFIHVRGKPARNEPNNLWSELQARSRRATTSLIVKTKVPGVQFGRNLLRVVIARLLYDAANLFARSDWKSLVVGLLATIQLVSRVRSVRRHCRQCGMRGPHWLDVESTAPSKIVPIVEK